MNSTSEKATESLKEPCKEEAAAEPCISDLEIDYYIISSPVGPVGTEPTKPENDQQLATPPCTPKKPPKSREKDRRNGNGRKKANDRTKALALEAEGEDPNHSDQATTLTSNKVKTNVSQEVPVTPRKRYGWFGTDARAWVKGTGSPAQARPWIETYVEEQLGPQHFMQQARESGELT